MQIGSVTDYAYSPFTGAGTRNAAVASTDFAQVLKTQTATPVSGGRQVNFTHLTADDKSVIKAATGITLAPDGSVAENLTGEFPDWGTILQINDDREGGQLQGLMTSGYIQSIIDRTPIEALGGAHGRNLNVALDFLTQRESGSQAHARIDVVA